MVRPTRDVYDRLVSLDKMVRGIQPKNDKQVLIDSKRIAETIRQFKRSGDHYDLLVGFTEILLNKQVDSAPAADDKSFHAGVTYGIRMFMRKLDEFEADFGKRILRADQVQQQEKRAERNAKETKPGYGGV